VTVLADEAPAACTNSRFHCSGGKFVDPTQGDRVGIEKKYSWMLKKLETLITGRSESAVSIVGEQADVRAPEHFFARVVRGCVIDHDYVESREAAAGIQTRADLISRVPADYDDADHAARAKYQRQYQSRCPDLQISVRITVSLSLSSDSSAGSPGPRIFRKSRKPCHFPASHAPPQP
jgi:hypothetical protein